MQLKTILNRVTNYKSFVFGIVTRLEDAAIPTVEVEIVPRRKRLAQLMIDHDVGVATSGTYRLKEVSDDFFDEEA